ncbi:MAG: hypothetical protein WAP03_30610 [Methylorubrum rhodinum]|uniref:hypothetical protein n=1 Tax=Methylorubrum rhodinum TaxID=29428 RepID=UPI003BB16AF3
MSSFVGKNLNERSRPIIGLVFIATLFPHDSAANQDMLDWCVKSYPHRVKWCKSQYSGHVNEEILKEANDAKARADKSVQSRANTSGDGESGEVEAVRAVPVSSGGDPVLFVDIRRTQNVFCPADGLAWVLAERDGTFYALNGIARSWHSNMAVYKSGKWHKVLDGGVGERSAFGIKETSRLISLGNDLCPTPAGSFIDVQFERLQRGERQAKELSAKYGH